MKNFALLATLFLFAGCVSTDDLMEQYYNPGRPGYISQKKSDFDHRVELHMEPAYLADATSLFRMGLLFTTELPAEKLILIAEWGEPKNFSPGSGLKLNIDGKIYELPAVDRYEFGVKVNKSAVSKHGATSLGYQTHKKFWLSYDVAQAIVDASSVVVRLELLNSYWEEKVEPTQEAMPVYNKHKSLWVKGGFRQFLAKVNAI